MQGADWARLSHPFTPEAIGWYVVEYSEDRSQVRLAPFLKSPAVISRLDEVCGRSNWSFQLAPLGAHALVCNLSVAGVGRAAVSGAPVRVPRGEDEFAPDSAASDRAPDPASDPTSDPGPDLDPDVLAAVALSNCAALFGMPVPRVDDDDWVDFDPVAREPLYTPLLARQEAPLVVGTGTVPAGQHESGALPGAGESGAREAGVLESGVDGPGAADTDERRSDGHHVIDRLLERLKAEGLGKEAARLVVAHNGYGRTAEESRELYGKLRSLLLDRKLVAP